MTEPGRVVVLNGVPRSGKSTIAAELIRRADDDWVNLGVDSAMMATPTDLLPGIGLRPGGERPDLEPFVQQSYRDLFDAVVAACQTGQRVVVDVGIHDSYSQPLGIWDHMLRQLEPVDVRCVGVHCSLAVLRRRRAASGYLSWNRGDQVPEPVLRWQHSVHADKTYDLDIDTSATSAAELAASVSAMLLH